jgi:Zn-dependent M28 family amino/carboxypeptidase
MQQGRLLGELSRGASAGARAWVFLFNLPARFVAARARDALTAQYEVPGLAGIIPLPLLLMRDSSAADVLRAAGENLLALRDTALHAVRPLRGVTMSLHGGARVSDRTSAPNVIGILEGSDPQLRGEFVVISGHMDHVGVAGGGEGCTAQGADSICNGADDDGSGTIGVVELAQAFAQLQPRPRRSMIFLTVSGEERGLWGSGWYVAHPERPLDRTVADLHMDMIGRNWRDSIAVVGKEHSTIGAAVDRVNAAHPELGMRLVDDPWHGQYYMQSDHYSFARGGVPAIFLFNGEHPQLHTPKDEMGLIDAEKAARIVRMMFYLALDVANTTAAPAWDPAARQRIVQGAH